MPVFPISGIFRHDNYSLVSVFLFSCVFFSVCKMFIFLLIDTLCKKETSLHSVIGLAGKASKFN